MSEYVKLKWKYLSILFLLFGFAVTGRFYYDYIHYEDMLDKKILSLEKQIKHSFDISKKRISTKYITIADQLMIDEKLAEMFEKKDRKNMYKYFSKRYKNLSYHDKHLSLMHLFDTHNINILRMNEPYSYDENQTKIRPLIAYVNKTKKTKTAFDLSRNNIVYRVSVPFIHKEKHLGILEFGIRPDFFIDSINEDYKVEYQLLVKSKLLDRFHQKKGFKKLGNYYIVSQNKLFKNIAQKIDMTKKHQIIKDETKSYVIMTDLTFKCFNNNDVAKIILAKDITDFVNSKNESRLQANLISFSILSIAMLFIYIIFTQYVNIILNSYHKLTLLKQKSKYLKKKVDKDNLTKIYNKSYLNKYLKSFLENRCQGVIIFFDIDHFKKCNDTHGHMTGDKILSELSKTILNNIREEDLFARWGGEEFAILLQNASDTEALGVAQKLRNIVENKAFANNIKVTISLGISRVAEDDTVDSLMQRVDKLLYQAKESGRNKVVTDI